MYVNCISHTWQKRKLNKNMKWLAQGLTTLVFQPPRACDAVLFSAVGVIGQGQPGSRQFVTRSRYVLYCSVIFRLLIMFYSFIQLLVSLLFWIRSDDIGSPKAWRFDNRLKKGLLKHIPIIVNVKPPWKSSNESFCMLAFIKLWTWEQEIITLRLRCFQRDAGQCLSYGEPLFSAELLMVKEIIDLGKKKQTHTVFLKNASSLE